ncbi:riboflavin synthase [Helicobacter magdeburgensis]|uniref:Riboflavin synthase n=1 Tax=Helicobacter magdeburgensis TaxID=471858 RepID=A0A4U8T189_9HELI|nr:riboflavin synthase [Helicobacter magdeburgensis]TLD93200.1 riboflavin synthase [Helicobacter magdeburgensis]
MFSGLVREIARVKSFTNNTLEIYTDYQAKLGDSIAINGACLTAIAFFQGGVTMELSNHTKQHIAIENFTPNAKVHLEPALSLGDRFDGHIVQGHIDGIGTISYITHNADSSDFFIQTNEAMLELMIPKGSVCVDGISLTIVDSNDKGFKLTIIPHTLKNTLFGEYQIGRKVNIESDVITRSVVSTLRNMSRNSKNALSWRDIDMMNLNY